MQSFRGRGILITAFVVGVYGFSAVFGQENAADKLKPLQAKASALSAAEKAIVTEFITEQLHRLTTEVSKVVTRSYTDVLKQAALARERNALIEAGKGSQQYRSAYLGILSTQILTRIASQGAQTSVNDMLVLSGLGSSLLKDAYLKALTVKGPALHYLSVVGLQKARKQLTAAEIGTIAPALVKLGSGDPGDAVLGGVYEFLDDPQSAPCRDGLLALLKVRAGAYAKESVAVYASDHGLVERIGKAYGAATEVQQKEAVGALAAMLKASAMYGVKESVLAATRVRRARLALVCYGAEGVLATITKQHANRPVTTALGNRNAEAVTKALTDWMGDGTTAAVLNKEPYSLKPQITKADG